ncbi:MAG: OmpH family outer membrane protein [Flavobacteriales bacterium]|nr:hypothetical protein [Flavobacteriales bacterium]MCC6578479.1 OmpH family outer membrane protein [Flavobacteriales bacterium]NUQ13899.1 OmpH family outer membrane protein [Flavobacteriales bacterium]
MHAKLTPVLLGWNVLLTALVAWALWGRDTRGGTATTPVAADSSGTGLVVPRDTAALANARIACFYMDSVQQRYELVKERGDAFRSEGKRLEGNLQSELAKAQGRYEELMRKDHTYSTQAEIKADEQEVQALMARIQDMQARGERQMAELEMRMLEEISTEIMDFLKEYNATAQHDYIFSVQSGGQIWVGNPALDITPQVIDGLNARHRAARNAAAPAKGAGTKP